MGNINLLLYFKIWLTIRKYQIYEGRNSLRESREEKKLKKLTPEEMKITYFSPPQIKRILITILRETQRIMYP